MRRLLALSLLLTAALPPAAPARAAVVIDLIPPVDGPIVRHFEPPPTPYEAGHRGIDLQTPLGTTVVAAAAGVVAFAGQVGGELFVSIDHPEGVRSTYSFLSAVLVGRSQTLAQGEPVGRSGAGHAGSERPELHFGVRQGDDYLDPEPLLLDSIRRNVWRVIALAPA